MKTGGIDVAAGVVDITADNFRVTNNAGEQTLGLDANGNLALMGTVYARTYTITYRFLDIPPQLLY